jgi:hypothetical protein
MKIGYDTKHQAKEIYIFNLLETGVLVRLAPGLLFISYVPLQHVYAL